MSTLRLHRPVASEATSRVAMRPASGTSGSIPRRRAALGHPGHAMADVAGADGEICVRYEAVYRRADPACGERRLLLAVLEDGIRTFLKYAQATHGRGLNLQREALAWLTTDDRREVFSFENICETLGIDASRLRERVLAEGASDGREEAVH